MYAIIATGGKQYKVAEGDVIKVEKLGVEAGETVTFDNVIAVSNDGLKVGEDVKDASVTASVVENGKAKKVNVVLGDNVGENVIIRSGLQIGDKVIIEGQQKVSDGMKVKE